MTHLDDEQLQRTAHGELASGDEASRAHLASCGDCRQRLEAMTRDETEIDGLLRLLDHPAPAITAATIAARARTPDRGWMRLAASIVVALALAGVAYAAPGSPLPRWITSATSLLNDGDASVRPHPAADDVLPVTGGIAVAPGASLLIRFSSTQTTGHAGVTLTDSGEVVVRAIVGAATFTAGVDRLLIDNAGSTANYDIRIPRSARRVEIRVGERRIFLKDRSTLITDGSADAREPVVFPLTP